MGACAAACGEPGVDHQRPGRGLCAGRTGATGSDRGAGQAGRAGRGSSGQPRSKPSGQPGRGPGAAVAPATAAGAVAQVKPKGSMTMVIEAEPPTILIKDATTDNASFVMGNVFDQLTARDWSTGDPKIVGELAESFSQSQTDPKTWRFKLRQGLKFINGEPITADAVVAVVDSVVDPAKPGTGIDEFGLTGGKATKIDEYTVDITTANADAIFPGRLVRMSIPAPKWLASMPNDSLDHPGGRQRALQAGRVHQGQPLPAQGQRRLLGTEQAQDRRDQDHLPERSGGAGQHDPGWRGRVGHPADPRGG